MVGHYIFMGGIMRGMKIIMNSGKEYTNDIDESKQEFLIRAYGPELSYSYVSLDKAKKITINAQSISSIELD